jgi:hypothetical protein
VESKKYSAKMHNNDTGSSWKGFTEMSTSPILVYYLVSKINANAK